MDELSRQVGANLRRLRRVQGLSLDVVAGRSSLSKSFLSRVERGERHLERRSHLSAVAEALSCSIADLVGQPLPPVGAEQQQTLASVPTLRHVLQGLAFGYVDDAGGLVSMDSIERRAGQLWNARRCCDYRLIVRLLPGLLTDLHVQTSRGGSVQRALELMVEVSSAAAFWLRGAGFSDLAWTAAQQCYVAAEQLGDPTAIGFADFTRAQVSTLGPGYGGALRLAENAVDALRSHLDSDPEPYRVYGTLLLTMAWAAEVLHAEGERDTAVAEACAIATRVGDPAPTGDKWQTYFGPANAGIWLMSLAVESGKGGKTVEIAQSVDLSVIDSASRRAAYWTELGCGLAQERGKEAEAVSALLRAEQTARQRTHNNPRVRSVVTTLLDRTHRRALSTNLRRIASRIGATSSTAY